MTGRVITHEVTLPEGGVWGGAHADALERGLTHMHSDEWSAFGATIEQMPDELLVKSDVGSWSGTYVYRYDTGIVLLGFDKSYQVRVVTFAASPAQAEALVTAVREALPEQDDPTEEKVAVSFWTYSPQGPSNVTRMLDAPSWEEIQGNYSSKTRGTLDHLFGEKFRPGHGGQFVLWHGEPGTGKTTALRSLAREWRKWCSFHYIADPDNFFGSTADYMLNVLLRGEEVHVGRRAHLLDDDDTQPKWRVLILEDTGELLREDARERVGQALSRFLNVVDGMIGQGLRVLVFVTTNEPLGKLHPAVTRPGRGALTVEFTSLDQEEANTWLEQHDLPLDFAQNSRILADLYAELADFKQRRHTQERVLGFQA